MPVEPVHCLVVSPQARSGGDARSAGLLHEAHALGLARLSGLACHDLYFIVGQLSEAERATLRDLYLANGGSL